MTIDDLRDLNCDAAVQRVGWRGDTRQPAVNEKDMEHLWEAIEKITNHLIAGALKEAR